MTTKWANLNRFDAEQTVRERSGRYRVGKVIDSPRNRTQTLRVPQDIMAELVQLAFTRFK